MTQYENTHIIPVLKAKFKIHTEYFLLIMTNLCLPDIPEEGKEE